MCAGHKNIFKVDHTDRSVTHCWLETGFTKLGWFDTTCAAAGQKWHSKIIGVLYCKGTSFFVFLQNAASSQFLTFSLRMARSWKRKSVIYYYWFWCRISFIQQLRTQKIQQLKKLNYNWYIYVNNLEVWRDVQSYLLFAICNFCSNFVLWIHPVYGFYAHASTFVIFFV